ncbi:unnamed protein product, partial [Mesorhabditis belari]|uniref:Uncharacterized protein n=1 Tax=Mesorhabditis belari TaxID=2138241 RepID=A0AAF3EF10_9BILA
MWWNWFHFGVFTVFWKLVNGVARFEPTTITDNSLVIKMIKAENVSSFDMLVYIYDLDRQVEFRKTELRGSQRDQLFSFDGLSPSTWFAVRIHYRLFFGTQPNVVLSDLSTKQELIVKTKTSPKENPEKIATVVVPEMRCGKGVIKPLAQQASPRARFHFDVGQVGMKTKDCTQICIFPFLRVQITNGTSETFRGKEWCGTVQEANKKEQNLCKRNEIHLEMLEETSTVLSIVKMPMFSSKPSSER